MYSISTNFFPDHKEAMIGYIEAATGAGMVLGPPIGSCLYYLGGYPLIYNGFGASLIALSFLVKLVFSADVDKV
jgi:MFS family permease